MERDVRGGVGMGGEGKGREGRRWEGRGREGSVVESKKILKIDPVHKLKANDITDIQATCIERTPAGGAPRWNFVKMFDADKTRMTGLPYGEKRL